jgi:hypothetical protein
MMMFEEIDIWSQAVLDVPGGVQVLELIPVDRVKEGHQYGQAEKNPQQDFHDG